MHCINFFVLLEKDLACSYPQHKTEIKSKIHYSLININERSVTLINTFPQEFMKNSAFSYKSPNYTRNLFSLRQVYFRIFQAS